MIKIGKQSEEGSFKLYKGVAALNIIAVNPTKSPTTPPPIAINKSLFVNSYSNNVS